MSPRLLMAFTGLGLALWSAGGSEAADWYAGARTATTHVEVYRFLSWEHGPRRASSGVSGGVRLRKHLAIDLSYLRATGLEWTEDPAVLPSLPGHYRSETSFDATAVQVSAVGVFPFGGIWDAYVKGGLSRYRLAGQQHVSDWVGVSTDLTRRFAVSGTGGLLGGGLGVSVSPRWHVRVEYQFFEVEPTVFGVAPGNPPTLDSISLGFDYRFGSASR